MEQEKTSTAQFNGSKRWTRLPGLLLAAQQSGTRWNRLVKLALVFFLFLIIFIVPAGWLPGVALWGQQMGISARQAQSASIGRLLWTWVSGGEAVFALQPQLSEDSSSEEAVAQQPAADITAPVLFKMDKKAADTDGIKGVYVAPNPDQLHMDRALRKAFARRIDPSASLIKESAAGKDLEQMWQSSTQAQNASDFVRAERTAQSAYIN